MRREAYLFLIEKLAQRLDFFIYFGIIIFDELLLIFTALKELSVLRFYAERKRMLKVFKIYSVAALSLAANRNVLSALKILSGWNLYFGNLGGTTDFCFVPFFGVKLF